MPLNQNRHEMFNFYYYFHRSSRSNFKCFCLWLYTYTALNSITFAIIYKTLFVYLNILHCLAVSSMSHKKFSFSQNYHVFFRVLLFKMSIKNNKYSSISHTQVFIQKKYKLMSALLLLSANSRFFCVCLCCKVYLVLFSLLESLVAV